MAEASNVLGGPLETCCLSPVTGYYRDGMCRTGAGDMGPMVCAQVMEEFWNLLDQGGMIYLHQSRLLIFLV